MNLSKTSVCFLSGLTMFLVNLGLGISKAGGLGLQVFAVMIAPGFFFGLLLVICFAKKRTVRKTLTFLFLSTTLHYMASIIATGGPMPGTSHWYNFPLGATVGAVGLFLGVKDFIDPALSDRSGLEGALVTGIASGLICFIGIRLESQGLPQSVSIMSIFLSWQTLFGWTLDRATVPEEDAFPEAHVLEQNEN